MKAHVDRHPPARNALAERAAAGGLHVVVVPRVILGQDLEAELQLRHAAGRPDLVFLVGLLVVRRLLAPVVELHIPAQRRPLGPGLRAAGVSGTQRAGGRTQPPPRAAGHCYHSDLL